MPKNPVNDLITDQEMAYVHLLLSGTMTDRRAAEAVGLNPDTAAYTKAKPRVRAYMLEHRAAVQERLVQQETEEVRRLNQSRERVLARLWEIAGLDPEMTRNSASAQMKALAMIVAIEGLLPDRRAVSPEKKSEKKSAPPLHGQIDTAAWLREQQGKTVDPPSVAADAPSDPDPTLDPSGPILVRPSSPTETAPSSPHACVPTSAPDKPVSSSIENKPDTWRLRL
jgi:hypothetical protein